MDLNPLLEPRFWEAIAFFLFFGLFGAKLWSISVKMLDDRSATIRSELAEVTRLRTEAEAMLQEAEARRGQVTAEATALIAQAREEARRIAEAAEKEARAAAARRERMAIDSITAAEKAAVNEVRTVAADIATRAAEELIAESLSAEADHALIDRAIARLPAVLATQSAA